MAVIRELAVNNIGFIQQGESSCMLGQHSAAVAQRGSPVPWSRCSCLPLLGFSLHVHACLISNRVTARVLAAIVPQSKALASPSVGRRRHPGCCAACCLPPCRIPGPSTLACQLQCQVPAACCAQAWFSPGLRLPLAVSSGSAGPTHRTGREVSPASTGKDWEGWVRSGQSSSSAVPVLGVISYESWK